MSAPRKSNTWVPYSEAVELNSDSENEFEDNTAIKSTWNRVLPSAFEQLKKAKPAKRSRTINWPPLPLEEQNKILPNKHRAATDEDKEFHHRRLLNATEHPVARENTERAQKTTLPTDHEVIKNILKSYVPKRADDLALHSAKIVELRNWLRHCDTMKRQSPAQIGLLTGPSGSSKTTALQVLAKESGYSVLSFTVSNDEYIIGTLGDSDGTAPFKRSILDAFKFFLFSGSRFKSLFLPNEKRMLLVKDFPHSVSSNAALFEELLANFVIVARAPLLFIVTDTKYKRNDFATYLFPDHVRQKFGMRHIRFNQIADTIMQKGLKRLSQLMCRQNTETYTIPTQQLLDSIILSANGDIRNATINLHFSSIKCTTAVRMEEVREKILKLDSSSSKRRSRAKAKYKLKSVGLEESGNFYNTQGRVFNPKYTVDGKLSHCPEEIADKFSLKAKYFTASLHENYLTHFSEIDDVQLANNDLCESDLMLNEYRDDTVPQIGLNLAVRSLMVNNSRPRKIWAPARPPKYLNSNSMLEGLNDSVKNFSGRTSGISTRKYATEYSSYVKIIST